MYANLLGSEDLVGWRGAKVTEPLLLGGVGVGLREYYTIPQNKLLIKRKSPRPLAGPLKKGAVLNGTPFLRGSAKPGGFLIVHIFLVFGIRHNLGVINTQTASKTPFSLVGRSGKGLKPLALNT